VVRPELVEMPRNVEGPSGFKSSEKRVFPVVSEHSGNFEMPCDDLAIMGCEELFYQKRDIQDTGVLKELVGGPVQEAFWESFVWGKYKN
jgi:hypothetical protein